MHLRTRWPLLLTVALCVVAIQARAQAPTTGEPTPAVGSDAAPPSPELEPEEDDEDEDYTAAIDASRSRTLGGLATRISEVEEQIALSRRDLKRAATATERKEAEADITELEHKLKELRESFRGLATGLDLDTIDDSPDKEIAWDSEASELLKPILRELREATKRPRELEKQRVRVVHFQERLPKVEQAIARVTRELKKAGPGRQRQELKEARATLIELRRELSDQLQLARAQLTELEHNDESLVESTSNIVSAFFRSRGMNFFAALGTFIMVFLLLRLLHRMIAVRLQRQEERISGLGLRVFDLMAYAGTTVIALVALLAVLYTAGDWVLLTLVVLIMAGILWSARNWVPELWEEIKLLLDIGAVRQGERVVYDDVPWRVSRLQLISVLENPAFPQTRLRLPLRDLVELHSRPYGEDEPWFPCAPGDWVTLDGELAVEVISISPEMVQVREGSMRQTFPTGDFLAEAPTNLSSGFRHRRIMRFDYSLQDKVTHQIPERLDTIVREQLAKDEMGHHLEDLDVGFDAASEHSLDVEIVADFSGAAAAHWERLGELLELIAVDASLAEGWPLALPQLTIRKQGA